MCLTRLFSFRFLYGKCKAAQCFLSHTSTPDNMPDCNFFLKGFCKEESCRYRHVKVNADAGICKDFATGFCSKGAKVNQDFLLNVCLTHSISIFQCESLHQFLCKSFFKTGQCPKGTKCTLAHLKVWPTAQAMIVGRKRSLAAASTKTAPVASTSSNASEAPKSKYRKVNPAINSSTSSSISKMVPPATASVPKISSSTAARPNREMLNSLLTRRLRCNSESNKQIVCQESDGLPKIDSSTEYIALSTDATATTTGAASSDQAAAAASAAASSQMSVITTTTKKNYPGTDPKRLGKYHHQASSSSSAPATATAATVLSSASSSAAAAAQVAPPPQPQPAKRAKYFVVDHEEEKLFDYLTNFSTTSATSVDSICRPQLKIIPDFLLGK